MSAWYNTAKHEFAVGTLDLSALYVLFTGTGTLSYVFDADHDVVDNGANDASDPSHCEFNATGYVGGYGGAGRHQVVQTGWALNKPSNRTEWDGSDPAQWPGLGPGDTLEYILAYEKRASDATNRLVAFIDTVTGPLTLPYVANGADYNLALATSGLFHLV